jgi:hypothetical protein
VSENKSQRRGQAPARQQKGWRGERSLAIPIVVGLVVLAMIVGAVISIQNQRSRSSAMPGAILTPSNTLQAQPTFAMPYPNVSRISLQEAQDKLEQGQVVLLDVRSKSSYDQAHAQGALSVPEEEIVAHLDELPRDKEIILYCS